MAIPVIGLGAGGHAKVVMEILSMNKGYRLVGLLDAKTELHGHTLLGVPIVGGDDHLHGLVKQGITHFFVGLGSTGDISGRLRLYELGLEHGLKPVKAIHPHAIISSSTRMGEGITIMAGAIINADTILGDNVIVNTGAIIEHDCKIGNHVHIATGSRLAGAVHVAEGVHIGAGATVKEGIAISLYAVVGAGAVVVKDVPPHTVVAGVPARVLKTQQTGVR